MNNKSVRTRPFLKWAGNKYRCLDQIIAHFPPAQRLIEPFAGSCAILLNTNYSQNMIADQNQDLINLYQQIKTQGESFIDYCRTWFIAENNQADSFYQLRRQFNQSMDAYERAGLFLYLNRHAFNGLCRFNKKGEFNVPFGRYLRPYFPEKELRRFWQKSQNTEMIQADFQTSFSLAKPGDILYCDPPYLPISHTANFTAYTKNQFGFEQQEKLAELALQTANQGIDVFISNHDTATARKLYHKAVKIYSFPVQRSISANGKRRIKVQELLVHFSKK